MAGGIHFYDMHEMLKENAKKRRTREREHIMLLLAHNNMQLSGDW